MILVETNVRSLAVLISAFAASALAADPAPIRVETWLVTNPLPAPAPALAAESEKHLDNLLSEARFDRERLAPVEGDRFAAGAATATWSAATAIDWGARDSSAIAFAYTEVRVTRFTECTAELRTAQRAKLYLNGADVATKGAADALDAKEIGKATAELALEPGLHRLIVKGVFDPKGPPSFAVTLELKPKAADAALEIGSRPRRPLAIEDLLDAATIGNVSVSARGDRVAFSMRRPEVPAEFAKRWLEIRDTRDLSLIFSSETLGDFQNFQWLPDGSGFSYVVRDGEKGTLWRRDRDGGRAEVLLRDVEKLANHQWLGNRAAVVYGVTTDEKSDDRSVKRMRSLIDRLPGQRNVTHLYLANVDGTGFRQAIVTGDLSVNVNDVRRDGGALLFTRVDNQVAARPYAETAVYELDLTTMNATRLLGGGFLTGAVYAGDRILVLGGPSLDPAMAAASTAIPNDYQTRLYEFDRASGTLRSLLPGEGASIEQLVVAPDAAAVFLRLEAGLGVEVARFDLATNRLERLPIPFDVASGMAVADDGRRVVAYGTGLGVPQRAVSFDTANVAAGGPVWMPEEDRFARIELGATRDYDVTLKSGESIEGYVHLPLGFDPAKTYPAIVFYYGGTSPIPKDFGGRYPRDLWAAHGYVVYSLTPSGATGRGDAFAARHVNDWGDRTCAEILECVDAFLAAHPFVDAKRLGCIGASYGGFMTLSLATKTDRFRAAVSHAGISALHSYWGEGFWGYAYSAVATAEKFPWNAREIYVDKSPLFHADKITASVLLTHGEADTNVPLGESEQMYTALELLGKDVEFLKFAKEDHHILTYPVRKLWMKSLVAYFDWKLKDEPGWWKKLYPK
jgi:dipeptidyl aminopeptidase/acylaminoacyl peptidase